MDMIIPMALAIPVLIGLSAMTSATETAVTAASEARVRQLARRGDRRATVLAHLLEDKERLIGALLVANNVFNIAGASLATSVFLKLTGEIGVAIATFVMTVMVVVFAEVLPKTYAIRNADRLALFMSSTVAGLVRLVAPVSRMLKAVVQAVLDIVGAGGKGLASAAAAEDLRAKIAELRSLAPKYRHRAEMLRGVMDLDRLTVDDVMTHRTEITALNGDLGVTEARAAMANVQFSRCPVWQGDHDRIVGVLHARDLLQAPEDARITDVMREATFVPETVRLDRQLVAFQEAHTHMALVVDEHGTLRGLVTLEDLIEEIVGEILDESDLPLELPKPAADGTLDVRGQASPRDINRIMDWDLPETEPTVAALITRVAGRIPEVDTEITLGRHLAVVVQRKGYRIVRVRIAPATFQQEN